MFNKIFIFRVFLIILLFLIWSALFGSLLKHHYEDGENFKFLQKIAVNISKIPNTAEDMIENIILGKNPNPNKPPLMTKHKNKSRFEQFIPNQRNALLVLPRYDHSLSRSVVDIVDLNNFKVIHTYKHDIAEMNLQVQNTKEFPRIKIDDAPIRFEYRHPLLLDDGSLVSDSEYSIEFKIDFCSNLKWINDEERFHHSKMLDQEGNIWVGGQLIPQSKIVKDSGIVDINFRDDAIIKMNTNGEILYKKSVTEILIENKFIVNHNTIIEFSKWGDPIHLNDIEPAFTDTEYWKKGDVFLSINSQSAIVHYRPSTNKVINYITGPFAMQHDVDIISEKEISIFNNNNFINDNDYSEILIYNFKTNQFRKFFNDQLQNENVKTYSEGLSEILNDGSLMVEEQNHGRIILFNKNGKKEWEFVNKDKNGDIGFVSWSRIIEDEQFIEQFKLLVKSKKCTN
jgi:hypothetical protein